MENRRANLEKDINIIWTRTKLDITGRKKKPSELCKKHYLQITPEKTLVMFTTRIANHDDTYYYGFYTVDNGVEDFTNLMLSSYEEYLDKDVIHEMLDFYTKEEV